MADLGSVGREWGRAVLSAKRTVVSPMVYKRPTNLDTNELNVDVTGSLSGVVTIAGVPTEGIRVGLFHRSSMNLIGLRISSNTGAYSFNALDKNDLKNYFVTFLDPQENPAYNYSLVRDHLTAG